MPLQIIGCRNVLSFSWSRSLMVYIAFFGYCFGKQSYVRFIWTSKPREVSHIHSSSTPPHTRPPAFGRGRAEKWAHTCPLAQNGNSADGTQHRRPPPPVIADSPGHVTFRGSGRACVTCRHCQTAGSPRIRGIGVSVVWRSTCLGLHCRPRKTPSQPPSI